MEQWLPRQPLILTPTIPLMWTVGWLCTMSAYIILGGEPPIPKSVAGLCFTGFSCHFSDEYV